MVVGVSPGGYRGGDRLCAGAGLGVLSEVCGGRWWDQHQHHTERREDYSAPGDTEIHFSVSTEDFH